ncbi:hypothetical protein NEDG_00555 [Nematocida displodere]|uniref:Uncharacterized protein n=1 Tax=Nematocida displodere TaxID=1805483 RepID=A0A177EE37_9MICR|nr:hypothetical protein NEDG_00555 [Nematocida displodere]
MKERRREARNHPAKTAGPHSNFMTQKEKDFVSFLFCRLNKKKERLAPDFYTNTILPAPSSERKRPGAPEQPLFEGILGKATRKSTKKLAVDKSPQPKPFILKKRIISRTNIEKVYDLLNKKGLFTDAPAFSNEEQSEVVALLKETGEDLFNLDKGIVLLRRLLEGKDTARHFSPAIVSVLVERVRYIVSTAEFCKFTSEMIPFISSNLPLIKTDPDKLSEALLGNTAGVLIGHILLLVFKREDPEYFSTVSRVVATKLDDAKIKRLFQKTPPHIVWRLLATAVKALAQPEALALKKKLQPEIDQGLKNRSPGIIESIRVFSRKCQGEK